MRRAAVTATLGVVAMLAAAGCGGSGDSSTSATATTQRIEAQDALAKAQARTAETAIEAYATDHGGGYAGATAEDLKRIEPTLEKAPLDVSTTTHTYGISVESGSGTVFAVARTAGGAIQVKCNAPGRGGCPPNGDWTK